MEAPSLERRVEILEQRVELLQDLPPRMAAVEAQIVQLRTDMNNGFSALSYAINKMHAELTGRFEAFDRRFEAIDRRFDAIDKRFERMDKRFDAVDRRFDGIDKRLDSHAADLADIKRLL